MTGDHEPIDLLVIGGGINGAGIACDAAGRGLAVVLCEASDLAGATSQASSKLIHGGLRYLEHYELRLVREALKEREVLLAKAPHIAWPLRFVLPHTPELRPRWMLRAGLFLYDHLASRKTIPGSRAIRLRSSEHAAALKSGIDDGFTYWDCWVDDARLVVLNARAAADRGAQVLTRTRFAGAEALGGRWVVRLVDRDSGVARIFAARAIVNAAGPWTAETLAAIEPGARGSGQYNGERRRPAMRLVKGSHIVVPRMTAGDDAFILQTGDQRVVFVLPYEARFSLIGTTDVAFTGDPDKVAITPDEVAYLIAAVGRYFRQPPTAADVVWSFSGVRPLYDDNPDKPAQAVTRDYHLDVRTGGGAGPVVSVFGGKITTYRQLAEEVMQRLAPSFPQMKAPWTADRPLPGGDIPGQDVAAFVAGLRQLYPRLDAKLVAALARRHGTLAGDVLGDARTPEDLGRPIGASLTEREAHYFKAREWARTPEDVLWRRTKVGLHLDAPARAWAVALLERLL